MNSTYFMSTISGWPHLYYIWQRNTHTNALFVIDKWTLISGNFLGPTAGGPLVDWLGFTGMITVVYFYASL